MARGAVTVSGEVLDVNTRQGTSDRGPWAFTIVSVLAGKAVQEVRFSPESNLGLPKEGDHISVEVKLSTYKGYIQAEAVQYTPAVAVKSA